MFITVSYYSLALVKRIDKEFEEGKKRDEDF